MKCWNKSKSAKATNWIDEYCWIWMTSISFWINWIHLNNLLEVNWKWMNNDPWKWIISEQLLDHLNDVSSDELNEWNLDRYIALYDTIILIHSFWNETLKTIENWTNKPIEWSDECPIDDLSFLFSIEIEQLICFLFSNFAWNVQSFEEKIDWFSPLFLKSFEIDWNIWKYETEKLFKWLNWSYFSLISFEIWDNKLIVFVFIWSLNLFEID